MKNIESLKVLKILKENERQKISIVVDSDGIKYLKREISDDKREVYKTILSVDHPGIPKIFYVDFTDKTTVIEEYIEGDTLSDYIEKKGKISKKKVKYIALKVLSAIEALHKKSVIHRDIKPDNILINESGNVWLVDFEIARIYRNDMRKDTEQYGTFGYAPIEQFGILPTDFKTDIYAFGVTLNFLIEKLNIKGSLKKIADKCKRLDPTQRYYNVSRVKRAISFSQLKCPLIVIFIFVILVILVMSNLDFKEEEPDTYITDKNTSSISKKEENVKNEKVKEKDGKLKESVKNEEVKQADDKLKENEKTKETKKVKQADDKLKEDDVKQVATEEVIINKEPESESDITTETEKNEATEQKKEPTEEKLPEFEGDFADFGYTEFENKLSASYTFSPVCIFSSDTPYTHLFFLEDSNKKGKIRFGENETIVEADITLKNGSLSVKLCDEKGRSLVADFKYNGQFEYYKEYTENIRKNADIMCYDLDDDGDTELLIGLNEGILSTGTGSLYNPVNYCMAWCIKYDEQNGFTLCEGVMASKGAPFSITRYAQGLDVMWENFGDTAGYYLEGTKIMTY